MLAQRGKPREKRLRHDLTAFEVRDRVRAWRKEAEPSRAVEMEAVPDAVVRGGPEPARLGQVARLKACEPPQRVENELGLEGAVVLGPGGGPVAAAAGAAPRERAHVRVRPARLACFDDLLGAPPDQAGRRLLHAQEDAVPRQGTRDEGHDALRPREAGPAGHDPLDDGFEDVARADLSHGGASGRAARAAGAPRGA